MAKTIRKVHLIGLGAVGGVYASLLYKMNRDCISVIIDREREIEYRRGIIINDTPYHFNLSVPKVDDVKAEFIIIAVKGHHLEKAIKTITPLVGEDTVILSLLNGITSENDLGRVFGRDKVLHGFCVGISSNREKGKINYVNTGRIVFGEYFPGTKGKAAPVGDLFARAGINYTIPEDILREMWWKFMMNVGVNQISAVLRAAYGDFRASQEARDLMTAASREVLIIAQKEGILLREEDIREHIDIITTLHPEGKTSMFQDIEAGRKTEVEDFALTVMNLGKKHGIATPVNEVLYGMIRFLENRNHAI